MRNEYSVSGHPTIQDPTQVPEEFDHHLDHKALAFQYIEETYTQWLDLQDDFAEWNQIMEERYREYVFIRIPYPFTYFVSEKRNEGVQGELDEKTDHLVKLKAELNKLKTSAVSYPFNKSPFPLLIVFFVQPSISDTKKDSELLHKDLEKLKIILERYEARRDKLIDQIAVEKVELTKRSARNCSLVPGFAKKLTLAV